MSDAVLTAGASYKACSVKRFRRTKAKIEVIRDQIVAILKADHPMTVRQVFYQLVTRGAIEKTEEQYQGTVIRLLTDMRLSGRIRFAWIVDESRPCIVNRTYNSIAEAARDTAEFYRRNAMRECPDYLEIWCEKQALAGVIKSAADVYDVPVIISKGMPSLTQVYGTARQIYAAAKAGKQSYIYQFGDHDPSGVLIPHSIKRRLDEFCEKLGCSPPFIERVALTEEQIAGYKLPTRPTKREGNRHAQKFDGDSIELDALPSAVLRGMVRDCIERHISSRELEILRETEESERNLLCAWADEVEDDEDTA
jgi:hypothetical protein